MLKIKAKIKVYAGMFRHWYAMAVGKSYSHIPQPLGSMFVPATMAGYFNDLRGKAKWTGQVDCDGIPINFLDEKPCYFPTTIFQKTLGHWDEWLQSGKTETRHWDEFVNGALWAINNQQSGGGWAWPDLDQEHVACYSAMSQGQGASICARMYHITRDRKYLIAAESAIRLMLTSVEMGGTARSVPEGVILEEYVKERCDGVLNGWIFALFGLYDVGIVAPSSDKAEELAYLLRTLQHLLPRYDSGHWSYYDLHGTIASPFYHRLHISQIRALSRAFPSKTEFAVSLARFEEYDASNLCWVRAVLHKTAQKLRTPPSVILR